VREVLGALSLALDALALAGANHCPPPQFVPVFPPRQAAPTPAPSLTASVRRPATPLAPLKIVSTTLLLPRPIPTVDDDNYIVNYLGDHAGGQLLSVKHRRSQALAWAVIGNRESWDFAN
jgi:hypothetical protein